MDIHKPLKYFDIYTKQPSDDAKTGISRSSSNIQIVARSGKSAGGGLSSSKTRLRSKDGRNSSRKLHEGPSNGSSLDMPLQQKGSPTARLPLTAQSLARLSALNAAAATDEKLARAGQSHAPRSTSIALEEESDPVISKKPHAFQEEPLSFGKLRKFDKSPPIIAADTHLSSLVPPDIFAGPSSPVSAESLTNLAVTESFPELSASDARRSLGRQNSRRRGHHYSALHRTHSDDHMKRSKSVPAYTPQSIPVSIAASSSAQDTLASSSSISAATARCFARRSTERTRQDSEDSHDNPEIMSIHDIIKTYQGSTAAIRPSACASSPPVPTIPAKFRSGGQRILSIDEIVSMNSPALSAGRKLGYSDSPATIQQRQRQRTITNDSEASQGRSSIDSITGEVLRTIRQESLSPQPVAGPSSSSRLHHVRSQPSLPTASTSAFTPKKRQPSVYTDSPSDISSFVSPASSEHVRGRPSNDEEVTQYVRSPRLTRLLTLRRPPNHHLMVSLADVGCEDGHPVVVFLGLGSVRYLVALYDELAESLGLRLICIDRWGLGKTGDVPDSRRGFLEWATVVEEVLDQLGIKTFSMIAHSAGTPYALASSLRLEERVHGNIHLLAPWVSMQSESAGSYKWLKYVPSGVIKTAQAAEWKVQAWRLGKLPRLAVQGVGFNPNAPLSSDLAATSPIFAELGDDLQTDMEDGEESCQSGTKARSTSFDEEVDDDDLRGESVTVSSANFGQGQSSRSIHQERVLDSGRVPPGQVSLRLNLPRNQSRQTHQTARIGPKTPAKSSTLDLGTALMRASHAESLKGGTADLLAILQKSSRSAGFSYADVSRPVKVWHGLKDEKISLQSVLSLESVMQNCKVNVIPGADHSLMTNVPAFVQVLRAIASEWDISSHL